MTYFNTTNETNPELSVYRLKAGTQDKKILAWFHGQVFNTGYSPSQVQEAVLPDAPITSVRRSMSNLTSEGELVKTTEKRQGIYGRPEYVWKLPEPDISE